MNVIVDKRSTDSVFYDKELNQYAANNNIIKLQFTNNKSVLHNMCEFLGLVNGFNESEIEVLTYLNVTANEELIKRYTVNRPWSGILLIRRLAAAFGKSKRTYARAIDELFLKGVLIRTFDDNNNWEVKLNDVYHITAGDNVANATYAVIELKPSVTSKQ